MSEEEASRKERAHEGQSMCGMLEEQQGGQCGGSREERAADRRQGREGPGRGGECGVSGPFVIREVGESLQGSWQNNRSDLF